MSTVNTWMQFQHNCAQGDVLESFEHEQQRQFLTQLLASPSALYTHAAAFGVSPAAFQLKCWKELATVQGIILPVASKSEQKDPPSDATNA